MGISPPPPLLLFRPIGLWLFLLLPEAYLKSSIFQNRFATPLPAWLPPLPFPPSKLNISIALAPPVPPHAKINTFKINNQWL